MGKKLESEALKQYIKLKGLICRVWLFLRNSYRKTTERHLPYGIPQCYTCHPTQMNAPTLTPARQAGTRFILPPREERLS